MQRGIETFRTIAAIGILSAGLSGARVAPNVSAETVVQDGRRIVTLAQEIVHRDIDFSVWPRWEGESGCSLQYPDPVTGHYHILVRCPNYTTGALIPGSFRDFDLAMDIEHVSGTNFQYGPIFVVNQGTSHEKEYHFLVSDGGVLHYKQIEYDEDMIKRAQLITTNVLSITETEGSEQLRIIRNGPHVDVMYNGTPLFAYEMLIGDQDTFLGFVVHTTQSFAPEEEVHVVIKKLQISYPQLRQRTDPILA